MTDDTYNGWKNYPTWVVNLWLSNDEGLYHCVSEMAAETMVEDESTSEYWTLDESRLYGLADRIKDFVTDTDGDGGISPDLGGTFAADLLGYALDQVDWNEIARHWLEQVEA